MHDSLHGEVLVGREILGDRLTMFERSDKHIAELYVESWEERDVVVVAVNDVFTVGVRSESTHETRIRSRSLRVLLGVERHALPIRRHNDIVPDTTARVTIAVTPVRRS